ncbi:hypothetical protein PS925_05758 [Pseudomonas fluorescens]|uniref:Bacterial Ig-like domain-containing protein n=1 Tax=Pseudomonas fluorescens TaxID=294 RepID=A0A5E7VS85_PSEFL|nr:hypothetical protein [Pseudomonas fluorescens]VVQ25377.1 hypothetical protein PS925_05758 [Pseudomonas fluorescens]
MQSQKTQTVISRIEDTNGRFLEDGADTTDSTLTLFGKGNPSDEIVITDEEHQFEPSFTVDGSGNWKAEIFDYERKMLVLTATGGNSVPSQKWSINVVPASPVLIDRVRDSKGEIENNGTTYDTQITANGRASPFTSVYVGPRVGGLYGETVIASQSGTWIAQLLNLNPSLHAIHAKAADSAVPSDMWVFTVNPEVKLGIDQVKDSLRPIEVGGSTYDPELRLFGWYSLGAGKVDLYDDEELIFSGLDIREGRWQTPPHTFAEKTYKFIVKTPDGERQSTAWPITVKPALLLTIDSVRDSQGEIADGGDTGEMQLQLRGRAPENALGLKIYDGDDYLTEATILDRGNWTASVSLSAIKDYVFYAKTADSGQSSNAWKIQVREKTMLFIQSVRGENLVPIGNPGETPFTTLKLIGRAERGEHGYIVDGSVTPPQDLFPFQADKDNHWEVDIPYLERREYRFIAKSSTGRESKSWVIRILPQ